MKTRTIAAAAILGLFLVSSLSVASAHSGLFAPKTSSGIQDRGSDGEDHGDNQSTTTTQTQEDNQNTTVAHADQVTATTEQDIGDGGSDSSGDSQAPVTQLAVGDSVTITDLSGQFVGIQGSSTEGTATGSLTFMVTGILQDGVTVAITSGHFAIGNTTFALTGGSLVLREGEGSAVGSGNAGAARFIIEVSGLRVSGNLSVGNIQIDLKSGTSEFLISLGTHSSSGDSSGD